MSPLIMELEQGPNDVSKKADGSPVNIAFPFASVSKLLETFFHAFTARLPVGEGSARCPRKVTSSPGAHPSGAEKTMATVPMADACRLWLA